MIDKKLTLKQRVATLEKIVVVNYNTSRQQSARIIELLKEVKELKEK